MQIIFILLLLCTVAQTKTITIATYNVENLFDMQYSGLEYKEYIPNRHNWNKPILQKKLQNIAEVICDLDSDVIALQEIENDRILQKLQKKLKQVGCDYRYRAITDNKLTPIHNALLSKIPLKKYKDIEVVHHSRYRSMLEIDLKTDPRLKIFVVHWKSKASPESHRVVYAKALMKRIHKLSKRIEYIILGDFNEDYNEYKTIKQRDNDTHGITAINHILKTIKHNTLLRYHNAQNGYHYNLWMELPSYDRWSHNFYGDKEALDAIIIPNTLADGAQWEYIKDTFGVFKPKYLFSNIGQIKRWEYRYNEHIGRGYSDHLPVYAKFLLYTSSKKQKPKNSIKMSQTTISSLYNISKLDTPIELKDSKVIMKMNDSAIIKQRPDGRSILLYRCAKDLKVGRRYDILVFQKKVYNGLSEIVDIEIKKELGFVDIAPYIKRFDPVMLTSKKYISEVISNIEGTYTKRGINILGKNYPIYFRKEANRPKEGIKILLKKAIIGYYNDHNQLMIWSQDDWTRRK